MKQKQALQFSLLAILLGIFLCSSLAMAADTPSVLIRTAVVEEKLLNETLQAFGVLDPEPDQVMSLSLPRAGLINRVWVRLGQRVKSGDALLELVTSPDARMQYLQAKSAVAFAQSELERQQRLLSEQLATKSQLEVASRNLKDAQSTLEAQRQRGMDSLQETLRAPVDGIITRLDVSQGERVQSDSTAMLIASEKRLVARLGVEAEDLEFIQAGTPVIIRSVFDPDIKVSAYVREVHAMINPDTLLVEVLAPIPEDQIKGLVLGSRIIGDLQLSSHTSLVVPRSAILGTAPDFHIFLVRANKAVRVAIKTGLEQDDLIEVSGDVRAGDIVVASGNYQLTDAMAVRENPQ